MNDATDTRSRADKLNEALGQWVRDLAGNRGDRARLRRARTPADIMLERSFVDLLQVTGTMPPQPTNPVGGVLATMARTAFVLCRVDKVDPSTNFGIAMRGTDERPAVSRLRAEALFRSQDPEAACRALVPLLRLVAPFSPHDLYTAMADQEWGWRRKRLSWAVDYNRPAPSHPATAA